MAGKRDITLNVGYNVDDKQFKSSISDVKKALQGLQNIKPVNFKGTQSQLSQIKRLAAQVGTALTNSFNTSLNTVNVEKFYGNLKTDLSQVYTQFSKIGPQGQAAFNKVASSLVTTNTQLRESTTLLQTMGTTMMNTVKWGVASSVMNSFTSSVQQAFQYVKSLDSALTDIRIVTGDSTQQMAKFADQANRAAQQLGRSTMDYSKAALTFYQQGLSDEDVQARTEATLKAQNITGAGQEMADYLTAVWNGYKVANEEAELYVDKLAAVADSSASNMSQLAVAMSKVASTANALGVPVDSLNAQIATIVATTRQAPESVGNALKTIYARINDIATGAEDAQVSLGNYSEKMAELGFSVLDANGNLRDTGDVIEQIGGKWADLSREQQIYLARTMAGQRQYNNLIALFDNWSRYTDLVTISMDSQGATMEKNSRYMESLGAHMEQLGAAGQRLKSALVDSDSFKNLIDLGTNLTELFANFIESIGGGGNALLAFGSIATQVFSGTIAKEIGTTINQMKQNKQIIQDMKVKTQQTINQMGTDAYKDPNNAAWREYIDNLNQVHQSWSVLSQDERQAQQRRAEQIRLDSEQITSLKNTQKAAEDLAKTLTKGTGSLETGFQTKTIEGEAKKLQAALSEVEISYEQFVSKIYTAREKGSGAFVATSGLINDLQNLKKNFNLTEAQPFIDQLMKVKDASKMDEEALNSLLIAIKQFYSQIGQSAQGILNFDKDKQKIQQLKQHLENIVPTFKKVNEQSKTIFDIKQVTSFIGAIGQLAAGVSSLINLFKVWQNDNLSVGEKILQTFTNIGMTLPMLINSYNTIKSFITAYIPQLAAEYTYEKLITLEKQKQALLQTSSNGKYSGLKGQARGRYRQILAETKDLVARNTETSLSFGMIGDKISALLPMLSNMLPILIGIGATAAVIYGLYKAWNAASDAAEKAAQKAKQAKQSYNDIKKQADQVKSSFDKINSAEENLNSLTKGTDQWKSALEQVNNEVLDLIDKFPQLKQYVEVTADGMLKLRQGAQEAIASSYDTAKNAASQAYIQAERESTAAANRSLIVDASRQTGINTWGGFDSYILEKLVTAVQDHGADLLNNTDTIKEVLPNISQAKAELIQERKAQVVELVSKIDSNINAMQTLSTAVTQANLTGNQNYQNSGNKEVFAQLYNKAYQGVELGPQYKIISSTGEMVDNQKMIVDKWAQINNLSSDQVRIRRGVLQVQNQAGQWENKLKMELVKQQVAVAQAGDLSGQVAQKMQIVTNHAKQLGPALDAAYIALTGVQNLKFNNLSLKDINILSNLDDKQIKKMFGLDDKGVDAFKNRLSELGDEVSKGWQEFTKTLPASVQKAFNELNINQQDFSIDGAKILSRVLKNAFDESGIEGLDSLTEVLSSLTSEEQQLFAGLIDSTDLTGMSVEDLQEKIEEVGIHSPIAADALQQLINKLSKIGQFSTPESFYSTVQEAASGVVSSGKLDQENAKILQQAGLEIDKFFGHAADGGYKLAVSTQTFQQAINKLTLDKFLDSIQKTQDKINNISSFEGVDLTQSARINMSTGDESVAFNKELLDKQIQALDMIGAKSNEIAEIELKRSQNLPLLAQEIDTINQAIEANKQKLQDVASLQQAASEQVKIYREEIASTATSLEELRNLYYQIDENGDPLISAQDYSKYRNILLDDQIQKLDITKQQWEETAETVRDQLQSVSKSFNQMDQAAQEVQVDQLTERIFELGDALEQLQGVSEDTFKQIQRGINEGLDINQIEGVSELKNILSDIFQTDFSTEQLQENFDLIKSLANGNIEALDQLQAKLFQDYTAKIAAEVDQPKVDAALQTLNSIINATSLDDLPVGISLDDAGFTAALMQFADMAGLAADDINAILATIGFQPQVTQQEIPFDETNLSKDGGTYTYTVQMPEELGGGTRVINMTSDMVAEARANGSVKIPIINGKGIKYTGGSSTGRMSAPSFRPSSSGGGSGGGKKGGGGKGNKGSSGSDKKPSVEKTQKLSRQMQHIEPQRDPYHDINILLEKQEDIVDDIGEAEKKLVPRDKLRLGIFKQQNKALKEQQDLLEQKKSIAQSELIRLRNELLDSETGLGNNIKFNSNGQIANYNQALQNAANQYNKQIDIYNKAINEAQQAYNDWVINTYNTASAEQQENLKTELDRRKDALKDIKEDLKFQLEGHKKIYDQIVKNIEEYDKTKELQRDIAEQIEQINQQIYENRIADFRLKVDMALDTGQLERDWLDFENKFIKKIDKDDFLGNAKASVKELMSYFDSEQIQKTAQQISKIRDQIAIMQAGGTSYIYGNNLAQAKEDLEQFMEQQMDDLQDIQDLVDDIKDNYLDAIDDAKDQMDQQIEQYQRVGDLIEHNMKLTQLIYGDKAYDAMNKYYDLQRQNDQKSLESLRQQQKYWLQQMNNQIQGSDAWKAFKENYQDATDEIGKKMQDMLGNLADKFANQLQAAVDKVNKKLTGGLGTDYLEDEWDLVNSFDDKFLDPIESKMGIDDVSRVYEKAISQVNGNPKAQKQLNSLMQKQMKLLREKDHLTEYDLERAKASLEVEKARLALEQARDNKTKMRLRRDSQGNYTYQYVADEQKLSDLQAALADAQANLYNMDKQHYKQNLDDLYETFRDYVQKMTELEKQLSQAQTEQDKKRILARREMIQEQLGKRWSALYEDNGVLKDIYLPQSVSAALGVAQEIAPEILSSLSWFGNTNQGLADQIDALGGLIPGLKDTLQDFSNATQEFLSGRDKILETGGTNAQELLDVVNKSGKALDTNIAQAEKLTITNEKLFNSITKQIGAMQALVESTQNYLDNILDIQDTLLSIRSSYNTLQELNNPDKNSPSLTADNIPMTNYGLDTTKGSINTNVQDYNYTGNPLTDTAAIKQQLGAILAQYEKYLQDMAIAKFDTGGATGSWGDAEGRLAFLHEKQLVLNQEDTLNILKAVQAVRIITGSLTNFADNGLAALMNDSTGLLSGLNTSETLDQNVHIEANFPNVREHTEIEQAFNNLVNIASMHASRYRD